MKITKGNCATLYVCDNSLDDTPVFMLNKCEDAGQDSACKGCKMWQVEVEIVAVRELNNE